MGICKTCGQKGEVKVGRCHACHRKITSRSRRKGKDNERENDRYWTRNFPHLKVRRTPGSGALGMHFPGDHFVIAPTWSIFNRIYFEDKKTEKWNVWDWAAEALGGAQQSGKDLVFIDISKNRGEHYIVCPMTTLQKMTEASGLKILNILVENQTSPASWATRAEIIDKLAGMCAIAITGGPKYISGTGGPRSDWCIVGREAITAMLKKIEDQPRNTSNLY